MKTLQTMRGRLSLFAFINILVFGFDLIESRSSEIQLRRDNPALQISKYVTPEILTPDVSGRTLSACIQVWSRQA